MKLVIIGVGKVGETLLENFVKEQHDIIVVDTNQDKVRYIVDHYDVQGIVGSGLDKDTLLDAETNTADFVITCTSRDEMNILCCVLARKLGAKSTIARVRDPEFFNGFENVREDLGVDFFFNPELRAADEIRSVLKFPSAKNVESFAGGKARMVEFDILKGNPLVGKNLMQIGKEYGNKVLFGLVMRNGDALIPRGDFILKDGDAVNIIGDETEIVNFTKKIKMFKPKSKTVFIIGGGKLAYYLSKKLINDGVSVKIVEKDGDRATELSKELPAATILHLDATEQELLEEANLKNCDACVTLTGIDEENVILSLYAKESGVSKVITKITRPTLFGMAKTLGLDTVISPRNAIANHIVQFVRANQAVTGNGINTLYKLSGKVEALEFSVGEDFTALGKPIKQMQIDKRILIGGIVRDGQFVLPSGDTMFERGDKVIVVSSIKHLKELTQIIR